MQPAYKLTEHARQRMEERRINPWHILYALTKPPRQRRNGTMMHSSNRVTVITDPNRAIIITVYRTGIHDDDFLGGAWRNHG